VGPDSARLDVASLLPHPPSAFGGDDSAADDTCAPAWEHYSPSWSSRTDGGDTAGVHNSEVAPALAAYLTGTGLAVHARGDWLAMNPGLAWLYKCRLTEELANRNNLVPATDQMPAHAVMAGPVDIASLAGQAPARSSRLASRPDSGSCPSMPSSRATSMQFPQP